MLPYLIKNKSGLVLINSTYRNGLFFRYFSKSNSQRSNILYPNSTEEFTANLDNNNNIHIVLKDKKNHIIHLYQQGNRMLQNTLLEDEENNYKISNLKLLNNFNKMYLFYTALNPNENTADIIHHTIDDNDKIPPQSVLPIISLNTSYTCCTYNNNVYLLSISDENNKYNLELCNYNSDNNEWVYIDNLVESSFPITYCNMCIDSEGNFHVVYTQNQYGKYIINYIQRNSSDQLSKQIHSCATSIQPITFIYNNTLWINWQESDKLLMSLSTDNGKTFTIPQYCTLEGKNMTKITYLYNKKELGNLFGNLFYAKLDRVPELAILNQIDMDNINLYSNSNNELKTYISSLKNTYSVKYNKEYEKLLEENKKLKEIQEQISSQYENLSQLTKNVQKEGKKWRNKFYQSEEKAKNIKSKLEDIEESP